MRGEIAGRANGLIGCAAGAERIPVMDLSRSFLLLVALRSVAFSCFVSRTVCLQRLDAPFSSRFSFDPACCCLVVVVVVAVVVAGRCCCCRLGRVLLSLPSLGHAHFVVNSAIFLIFHCSWLYAQIDQSILFKHFGSVSCSNSTCHKWRTV